MKSIDKNILDGNRKIHMYMGYEMMSNEEIYISEKGIIKEGDDIESFVKRISNLPDMKKKGSVINKLSYNDVFYSDLLTYHKSLDDLMPVLEKLTKECYNYVDVFNTIETLLSYGENNRLVFSVENIWKKIVYKLENDEIV
jgi:hypothetical protein